MRPAAHGSNQLCGGCTRARASRLHAIKSFLWTYLSSQAFETGSPSLIQSAHLVSLIFYLIFQVSLLFISPSPCARVQNQLLCMVAARLMVLLQRDWIHNLWTASCNRFRLYLSAHNLVFTFICWPSSYTFCAIFDGVRERSSLNCNITWNRPSACSLNLVDTDPVRATSISVVQIFMFLFSIACHFGSMPIEFNILYCVTIDIRLIFHVFFFSLFFLFHSQCWSS